MGTPVPADWATLDPNLWFCVTVQAFDSFGIGADCDIGGASTFSQCKLGSVIIAWIQNDLQCSGVVLAGPPGFGFQRITNIGPGHAMQQDCIDAGCP